MRAPFCEVEIDGAVFEFAYGESGRYRRIDTYRAKRLGDNLVLTPEAGELCDVIVEGEPESVLNILSLMDKAGVLRIHNVSCTTLYFFEFLSEEDALAHRSTHGCGGWVLGRFLCPGTGWTPSLVMQHVKCEGELK